MHNKFTCARQSINFGLKEVYYVSSYKKKTVFDDNVVTDTKLWE